jgi:AmmeMemoRadiSam system protein A
VEHPLVELARDSLRKYLTTLRVPMTTGSSPPGGVFVSLHGASGLRGCVGSITGEEDTIEAEVSRQAINAAVHDPRFPPLREAEIDDLDITVYLLGTPEEVLGLSSLDPARFGVIVESARGRRGLLLPDLPGIDTPEAQVDIARRKAGIRPEESIRLYRFEALVLH